MLEDIISVCENKRRRAVSCGAYLENILQVWEFISKNNVHGFWQGNMMQMLFYQRNNIILTLPLISGKTFLK